MLFRSATLGAPYALRHQAGCGSCNIITNRVQVLRSKGNRAPTSSGLTPSQSADAIPGVDGKLLYTWKRDDQYFELEMLPDGTGEFFFRDGTTADTWSEDFRLGPSRARSRLLVLAVPAHEHGAGPAVGGLDDQG